MEEKEVSPNTSKDNFNPVYERMRPREIANYINTQFKMPANEAARNVKRRPINVLPHQKSPLDPRLNHHQRQQQQQQQQQQPQPMWDKNAGFTYTGNFSSDC